MPATLREVRRVLTPDGLLIVIDITAPEAPLHDTTLQAVELLRDGSHVRDYRPSEWEAMLSAADLRHERVGDWRLQMVFDEWTARMRTPAERVAAIRSLFAIARDETRRYFYVRDDCSFTIDATMFTASPTPQTR